jgi:soluble lytic murein transglycosylase-like protein
MKALIRALVLLIAPAVLCAQTAEMGSAPLDAWRAELNERLDRDIRQLRVAPQAISPALAAVAWDRGEERLPERASFLEPADRPGSLWPTAIAAILRDQGLPAGLVGVAAVESGFNPFALSRQGARGLWQLLPGTARRFGLVVNALRDERTDPVKSTFAAAQYLKTLHAQFRDWPLALAAYNAGEDRVQRSLSRLHTRDFWTLRRRAALPEETRRYVPAVLATLGGLATSHPALAAPQDPPRSEARAPERAGASAPPTRWAFAMTSPELDTPAGAE